jgi:tetratricopeptide (TPR) repeat protein
MGRMFCAGPLRLAGLAAHCFAAWGEGWWLKTSFILQFNFRGIFLALGMVCGIGAAFADTAEAQQSTQAGPDTDAAKLLLQEGRFADAKNLLAAMRSKNPNDPDALFLSGLIALSEENYSRAADLFSRLLAQKPDMVRVRLEYARALFLDKKYNAAEREFRRARAGDLPPEVNANIDKYLSFIRYLKTWNMNVSIAVAPDTNINGAPGLHQIDLFGIPFQLDDQARKASGVGVVIEAGGEYTPLVAERIKLRAGLQLRRAEYPGGDFDDMLGAVHFGPKFLFPRADLSLLGTAFRRDFGNSPYQWGWGGRIEGNYSLSSTFFLGAAADLQDIHYDRKYAPADRNGPLSALSISLAHVLTPTSTLRALGSIRRESAHSSAYANTGYYLALGYAQEFPYGFSTYVEPGLWHASYDGRMIAFGKAREDKRWSVRFEVLNRKIEYGGFVPRISFTLAEQNSNIPLYSYKRQSIEFGLIQLF